jgi:hypothetical protein
LIQLFGTYIADVAAEAGSFDFWGLACGDYLGPKGCLSTAVFRAVPSRWKIDLALPDPSKPCASPGK